MSFFTPLKREKGIPAAAQIEAIMNSFPFEAAHARLTAVYPTLCTLDQYRIHARQALITAFLETCEEDGKPSHIYYVANLQAIWVDGFAVLNEISKSVGFHEL